MFCVSENTMVIRKMKVFFMKVTFRGSYNIKYTLRHVKQWYYHNVNMG